MIDLILLAAGPARRFGQEQLLGEAGGVPLYRRAFEAARQAADAMMGLRVLVVTAKGCWTPPSGSLASTRLWCRRTGPSAPRWRREPGGPVRGQPVLPAL